MKCILSHTDDPYFNLAAEEYLLKSFDEEFYFQYVNRPAVVVGKHQNALAEVDQDYLEENDILLARRISGGGAVYHDPGNMNYSFITNESPGDFIKFKKYTAPVILALENLGVEARLGSRNELLAGVRKISGTASHVFKRRVLHHGTLLYETDLERLGKCLYIELGRYRDKAVKSIRSEVINISTIMEQPVPAADFYQAVFDHIAGSEHQVISFSKDDTRAIEKLVTEKFSSWEWNYGYSPKYEIEHSTSMDGELVRFNLQVNKGIITSAEIMGGAVAGRIGHLLTGVRHDRVIVEGVLEKEGIDADWQQVILRGLF